VALFAIARFIGRDRSKGRGRRAANRDLAPASAMPDLVVRGELS
jgi:hypothetical protein